MKFLDDSDDDSSLCNSDILESLPHSFTNSVLN